MTKKSNNTKHISYLVLAGVLSLAGVEAFADTATAVADSSAALSPILNKILGSLSGTLGKILMMISIAFSAIAGLAGMSRAVVLTPIGVGIILGNAKTIVDWMF